MEAESAAYHALDRQLQGEDLVLRFGDHLEDIAALKSQLADAKAEVKRLKRANEHWRERVSNLHAECHAHAEQHAGDESEIDAMQALCDAAVAFSYGVGPGRTARLLQAIDVYRAAQQPKEKPDGD